MRQDSPAELLRILERGEVIKSRVVAVDPKPVAQIGETANREGDLHRGITVGKGGLALWFCVPGQSGVSLIPSDAR